MTRETAVKAIEAWRANPATTFTPANILREFGDDILTALRDPAPQASEPAEAEAGKLADWILSYLENECALDPGCVAKSDRHNVANAVLNSVTGYMPHDLLRAGRELLDSPGIARIRVKSQGNDLLDRDEVFRRIIDGRLAAPLPHSAASTVEPVAYRWVLPGQHNWNVTIYHPRHHTTEQPSTIEPLYAAPTTLPNPVVADYATTETTDDDFLRNLIDWTHLYAFSGESWLSHKTADILIACARKKKATQQDAEALKVCPSIRPHAEHIGIDLIALARKECGPHE